MKYSGLYVHAINIAFLLLVLIFSYFAAHLLYKLNKNKEGINSSTRFTSIDGLRGYLALMVFIYHCTLSYHWKNTGVWELGEYLYMQTIGQIAVAIFFMITSFLFIYRLLTHADINWLQLFVNRVFRIYPLYLFVLVIVLMVAMMQSNFEWLVSGRDILIDTIRWLLFCGGSFNAYEETRTIIAKVDWTLKYEWLFYICLPSIALLMKRSKILVLLLMGGVLYFSIKPVYISFLFFYANTKFLIYFLMGGVAAYLKYRFPVGLVVLKGNSMALIGILALFLVSVLFDTAYDVGQAVLIMVFFLPVVYGNDCLGILNKKPSLLLGELSYSIYLMHGIILFVLFTQLMPNFIASTGYGYYYALTPLVALLVVLISYATNRIIERPMISYGRSLTITVKSEKIKGRPLESTC